MNSGEITDPLDAGGTAGPRLWPVLILVGLGGGVLAALVYLLTVGHGAFAVPAAPWIVVISMFLGGLMGVVSAGGAIVCRLLVPRRLRASWLAVVAIGVGAALGCTVAYLALFGGASQTNPALDIPVFDGIAVIVLGSTALVRIARKH